jgi:site-specific DNA-adenine methylase
MSERTIAGPMELRHGRWQDVLADVPACDLLLCDPPYSARNQRF